MNDQTLSDMPTDLPNDDLPDDYKENSHLLQSLRAGVDRGGEKSPAHPSESVEQGEDPGVQATE